MIPRPSDDSTDSLALSSDYNTATQETTWTRPASMDCGTTAAPVGNAVASTVATAMQVQKAKSKLWGLLNAGEFDDLVESDEVAAESEAAEKEKAAGGAGDGGGEEARRYATDPEGCLEDS